MPLTLFMRLTLKINYSFKNLKSICFLDAMTFQSHFDLLLHINGVWTLCSYMLSIFVHLQVSVHANTFDVTKFYGFF